MGITQVDIGKSNGPDGADRAVFNDRAARNHSAERGGVVGTGNRHRDRRGAGVAVRVSNRIGKGVGRGLAGRQVLPIGRVRRVYKAGGIGDRGCAAGARQRDRSVSRLCVGQGCDQVRHTVVGQHIDRDTGGLLACGHDVIDERHSVVARIESHAVDHHLQGLELRNCQAEREGEVGVARLTVHRVCDLCKERQEARDVSLDRRALPLRAGQHQLERIAARAPVVDIGRTNVLAQNIDAQIVAGIAVDDVIARAAIHDVVARAGVDAVVAAHSVDVVRARTTVQVFVGRGAGDGVRARFRHCSPLD